MPDPSDHPHAPGAEPHDEVAFAPLAGVPQATASRPDELGRVLDVPVELSVELGRARMTIGEALALAPGSVLTLDRLAGRPVDLLVNGRAIARGQVVVVDDAFGLRVSELVAPDAPPPSA